MLYLETSKHKTKVVLSWNVLFLQYVYFAIKTLFLQINFFGVKWRFCTINVIVKCIYFTVRVLCYRTLILINNFLWRKMILYLKRWTVAEIKQCLLLTLIWNMKYYFYLSNHVAWFARARAEASTEHFRSPGLFWWPKFISNQGPVDSGHPLNILLLGLPWINFV